MTSNRVKRQTSNSPPMSPESAEEHLDTKCKYIKYKVQYDDGKICYVWLRKCVCGQRVDKSHLALMGNMSLRKQDGVDIHFNDNCYWAQWSIDSGNRLTRNCFEESHLQSAGTINVNRVSHMP